MVIFANTDMANLSWRLFFEFHLPVFAGFTHNPVNQYPQSPSQILVAKQAINPFAETSTVEPEIKHFERSSLNPFEDVTTTASQVPQLPSLEYGQQQNFGAASYPRETLVPNRHINSNTEARYSAQPNEPNHHYPQYQPYPQVQHYDSRLSNTTRGSIYRDTPSQEPPWGTDNTNIGQLAPANPHPADPKIQDTTPAHDRTISNMLQMFADPRTRGVSPGLQPAKSHSRSQGGMTTRTRESDENPVVRVQVLGHPGEVVEVPVAEMDLVRFTIQKAVQRRKT